MYSRIIFVCSILSILLFSACEEEITVNLPQGEEKVVVEGKIENDENPLILLTKNIPYFAALSPAELNNIWVKNAKVSIFDGKDTIKMQEIVVSKKDSVLTITIDGDTLPFPVPIPLDVPEGYQYVAYTNLTYKGILGRIYDLQIKTADNKTITARTTIPTPVLPDSVYFQVADTTNTVFIGDSCKAEFDAKNLMRLTIDFKDPENSAEYYRYMTSDDGFSYNANSNSNFTLSSVFGGQKVYGVWLQRIGARNEDRQCRDYVFKGDTVHLKWGNIDKAHYDFWDTYRNNVQGGGPFSPPIYVKSNIKGGLGYWGGYGRIIIKDLVAQ